MATQLALHRDCMVHDVRVHHEGEDHLASFVVENGLAHVPVEGRLVLMPVDDKDPAEGVTQLLIALAKIPALDREREGVVMTSPPQAKKSE